MELSAKVHDYLSYPGHRVFFAADIKHGYFAIPVHPDDRHYFAFTIPGLGSECLFNILHLLRLANNFFEPVIATLRSAIVQVDMESVISTYHMV